MLETAAGLADALAADGRYSLVTGRALDGLTPLVDAASLHVVAPGPTTRLTVADGMRLGGHRVVAVLDDLAPGPAPASDVLAVTTSGPCAADALSAGWLILQPWAPTDVAPLLAAATGPRLMLIGDSPALVFADPPDPRRTRLWLDGDMATLVASGAAVPTAVRLAERLQARGIDIAAVEVAVLSDPGQAPLVAGNSLLIAGRDTAQAFRGSNWPEVPVASVSLDGMEEADLIGAVLAVVPTA